MAHKTVEFVLGAAVVDTGTVTGIAYPPGTNQAFFTSPNDSATGVVIINDNDVYAEGDPGIDITYGASTITLTNDTGLTWAAGSSVILQLGYLTADTVTVIAQAAEADIAGTLTGTTDGTMANVADIALSTSDTYADADVNTAVNVAIAAVNLQLKELQVKQNALLAKLRAAGVLDS